MVNTIAIVVLFQERASYKVGVNHHLEHPIRTGQLTLPEGFITSVMRWDGSCVDFLASNRFI